MSIKGFIINSQTVKYNYPDLDNLPTEPSGGGVSEALKTALLQLASKVAYIDDDGADYYQDLYDALYGSATTYSITNTLTSVTNSNAATTIVEDSSYTATLSCAADYEITSVSVTMGGTDVTNTAYSSGTISIANVTGNIVITAVATQRAVTLSSIDAVFSQGQTVIYNTDSLDTLKQYLVVTANWDDSTTSTVASSDYTLSGSLTVGTSTITVSYGGKSDTFTVTVTEYVDPRTLLYNWDLTDSLTDKVGNVTAVLDGSTQPTQSSSGLTFNAATQNIYFGSYDMTGKTVEIDVSSFSFAGNSSYHIRFFMLANQATAGASGYGPIIFRSNNGWSGYGITTATGYSSRSWFSTPWISGTSSSVVNTFSGKTVKVVFGSDGHTATLYIGDTQIGTKTEHYYSNDSIRHFFIGGVKSGSQSGGDQCYNMTITGVRIYENEE